MGPSRRECMAKKCKAPKKNSDQARKADIVIITIILTIIIMKTTATKVTKAQGIKKVRNKKAHLLPVVGVVTRLIFHINAIRK